VQEIIANANVVELDGERVPIERVMIAMQEILKRAASGRTG
jgi:methyl-accepting chemotaxis protein